MQTRLMPTCGVCLSVCPSHSRILWKRIDIIFHFFHRRVATSVFFIPNVIAIFRRRSPNKGGSNAGGLGKNRDSRRIPGYRSMTGGFVYHSQHGRPWGREENRTFYIYAAEVANNRILRSTYCTIEANYWQTRTIVRPDLCDSRLPVSLSDIALPCFIDIH